MRRLLQRLEDGLYYQGPGTWTNNPEHAFHFHKSAAAAECCLREDLPLVQLVLKFEDSAFDIRVPCCSLGQVSQPPQVEPKASPNPVPRRHGSGTGSAFPPHSPTHPHHHHGLF